MSFELKQATISVIKQFHIKHSLDYIVEESIPDRYVGKCTKFGNCCQWRIRASLSKRRNRWEIKKIDNVHTCATSLISQDHRKLDSSIIVDCVLGLINANPGIPIKVLIEEVQDRYGYTITYRKGWKAKQKAVAQVFSD